MPTYEIIFLIITSITKGEKMRTIIYGFLAAFLILLVGCEELKEDSNKTIAKKQQAVTEGQQYLELFGVVKKGEWKYYGPYNTNDLNVTLSMPDSSGDADLYVKAGSKPSSRSWDCRPYKGSKKKETCSLNSSHKTYYVAVNGYSNKTNYRINISYFGYPAMYSMSTGGRSLEDQCSAILASGVFNEYRNDVYVEEDTTLKRYACSEGEAWAFDYSEYEQTSSGEGSGGLKLNVIDIFDVGAGGGGSSSSATAEERQMFRQWKESWCTQDDYSYSGTKSQHILIREADEEIVKAWRECMIYTAQVGLLCYGEEEGDLLNIKIFNKRENVLKVTNSTSYSVNLDYQGRSEDYQDDWSEVPISLFDNHPGAIIGFKVIDPQQPASFILNGTVGIFGDACNYFIPEERNEPEPRPEPESESYPPGLGPNGWDIHGGYSLGQCQMVTKEDKVSKNQWKHYGPYYFAKYGNLDIKMTGSGDADLYVKKGSQPSINDYDCRPYKTGSEESCGYRGNTVHNQKMYISVNGYTESSFKLEIKNCPPSSITP